MALYAKPRGAPAAQEGEWSTQALLGEVLVAPENVTARNVLALAAVRRGDYDEAERQYRVAGTTAEAAPRDGRARASRSVARSRWGGAAFPRGARSAPSYVER
jgi:hypothetical protein